LRVKQLEEKSKGTKELDIKAATKSATEGGETFFSSLVTKIVDNIQLSIKNVHLRYEDSFTNASNPFNIGIFLEDFSILSTDPNFTPAFLTESHSIIYKLLTLKKLAVYWNSNEPPLSFTSNRDMAQLLQQLIAKEQQYLIHPISLSVKAIVNKNREDSSIPQITGDILVNDITLSLSEIQYKDILNALDFYAKSEIRWKVNLYMGCSLISLHRIENSDPK
jgi:vacuolar protein sorting-associated protein 13A/C